MTCENCGKDKASIKQTTRSFGKGDDLMVIENIPLVHCSACGESYFTSETLHEIERIKLHRRELAAKRPIPVASFGKTAA
jgi:YgiT-type zinc finger domain-containing protein